MLQAEQILQERYQLQQQLGQNAGRQTWLAKDLKVSKILVGGHGYTAPTNDVIVKLLAFNPQIHWDELKLFEREAQVLKHIKHPQIPQYYDYFALKKTDNDLPWFGLVQEYIPGKSLQELLDKGKIFSEKEGKKIATEILNILIYLHELSPPVLHRDIKPSNLILGKDGQIYLVDFGAVQDKAAAEGATFTVVGTSGYAPPEQLWGKAVAASDLYAMGATLIQLLTGIAPADLPQRKMRMQFADKVRLDANFTQWLTKLIEPAPEQRFTTANQALSALEVSHSQGWESSKKSQYIEKNPRSLSLGSLILLQVLIVGIPVFFIWLISPIFHDVAYEAIVNRENENDQKVAEQKVAEQEVNRMNRSYEYIKTLHSPLTEISPSFSSQTDTYNYFTQAKSGAVLNYGLSKKYNLKSYVGGVFLSEENPAEAKGNSKYVSIVCETILPTAKQPPTPSYKNRILTCPPDTKEVKP